MSTELFPNTTFTWEFPRFSAHPTLNGLPNVVYNVEFILSATDGEGHGAQVFGSVGVSEPDPETFKNFSSLTHDVVEVWVESAMGEEMLNDYKTGLESQIQQQKQPPVVVLNKPW
jgi:NADH:ubiquinone oxidoreductase subunit F (NADH-binding)